MAETQAQNKLGELFVDLGVGGLGKTLKALNSVSASFLLTKNAAQQALSPIVDMSRQGGQLVTAFDKINAVTGISIEKLQKIRNWAKESNVPFESFEASLENIQQSLMDIRLGKGLNKGYQLLGIEAWKIDPKEPLKALDLIQAKLKQVDEVTAATALRELGMNTDLAYAFKQANIPISQAIEQNELNTLTKEEAQRLREQQEAWNKFDVQMETSKAKLISNVDAVSEGLNFLNENINPLTQNIINGLNWYTDRVRDLGINLRVKPNQSLINWDDPQLKNLSNKEKWNLYQKLQKQNEDVLAEEEAKYNNIAYPKKKATSNIEAQQVQPTIQNAVGATPINSPAETLPPLPNFEPTSYTTNNSNSQSINYSPTFNMQIDVSGDSAEQTSQIQQAIVSQQELTFTELLNMAGK